jgi:hypothetical protein
MAAFNASRLVCSAMSSIVSTMAPICSPLAPSSVTLTAAPSTASLMRAIPSTVWRTVVAPFVAASPAAAPRLWTSAEAREAERIERVIWSTAAAWASTLRAVSAAPPRTDSMTDWRSLTAFAVSPAARAWSDAPDATWPIVWAICADPWPDCCAASFTSAEVADTD